MFALRREQSQKNVQSLLRRDRLFAVKFVVFFDELEKTRAQIEKLIQKINELIIQNRNKDELLYKKKRLT